MRRRDERQEPPTIAGRPPPHSLEAELAVIANCMIRTSYSDASVIDRVSAVLGDLGPLAFYGEINAHLWRAITDLHAAGRGVDTVTVTARLQELDLWSRSTEEHLQLIVDKQPALIDRMTVDHARIVARKARMRRTIVMLQEWTARAYGDVPDDEVFLREATEAISDAARVMGVSEDAVHADETEGDLRAELAERQVAIEQGSSAGYPTGIPSLDALTGGLFPRGVHFFSGPAKGRKSTVAAWISVAVASSTERVIIGGAEQTQRRGVVFFPLEMNRTELQLIASCQHGQVDSQLFTKGGATYEDYRRRERGAEKFVHLPLVWDDRPGLSVDTLKARIREARAKLARGLPGRRRKRADGTIEIVPPIDPAPLRLVVIDTVQLLAKATPHRPNELQSVTDAAGAAIKRLAGTDPELARVSWLVLAHENASGDLRDSGALKNHLTQWVKQTVEENDSAWVGDRDQQVVRFKVHAWRQGEAGGECSAWLNRKTGAIS